MARASGREILVPVFAPIQPFENTPGAIALYGTLVIVAASYLRKRMNFWRWKAIHCINYPTVLTFAFHRLLTNPNLNDTPIDFMDGGKMFVILCVISVVLAVTGRAFYAGRAARPGATTLRSAEAPAARWEGRLRVAGKFVETSAVQTLRLMIEDGGRRHHPDDEHAAPPDRNTLGPSDRFDLRGPHAR
jgi:hypothetical protein